MLYTKKKVSNLEDEIFNLLSINWSKDAFIEELINDVEQLKLRVVSLENEIALAAKRRARFAKEVSKDNDTVKGTKSNKLVEVHKPTKPASNPKRVKKA